MFFIKNNTFFLFYLLHSLYQSKFCSISILLQNITWVVVTFYCFHFFLKIKQNNYFFNACTTMMIIIIMFQIVICSLQKVRCFLIITTNSNFRILGLQAFFTHTFLLYLYQGTTTFLQSTKKINRIMKQSMLFYISISKNQKRKL